MPLYQFEVLGSQHDRKGFNSGVPALDRYFREQVSQDVRRRATACYVGRARLAMGDPLKRLPSPFRAAKRRHHGASPRETVWR